jgi:hypothetical protein
VLKGYFVLHLALHIQELNFLSGQNATPSIQILHALDIIFDTLMAGELVQRLAGVPAAVYVTPMPPLHIELLICIRVFRAEFKALRIPANMNTAYKMRLQNLQ